MSAMPARRVDGWVSAAALAMSLPLLAVGTTALAGGSEVVEILPGIDARRVVLPAGDLAGHGISVSEVSSRLGPAEALAGVERHWRAADDAPPVLRAHGDGWSVLSRRTAQGYDTLQLRAAPRGGAEGLLTRWRMRDGGPPSETSLSSLLPVEARAVRQLRSSDAAGEGAREAQTLVGRLPHAIDEAERRVVVHLRRLGFVADPGTGASRALSWRDDRARFFRAAGTELLVTLHAQPAGTGVVLYHVRTTR